MKATLNIDDDLLAKAQRLTRIEEKTALVHAALTALIARKSAKRLAALGGSQPALVAIPRRYSASRRSA
jgi:Arc/MetJ family transcription regulator